MYQYYRKLCAIALSLCLTFQVNAQELLHYWNFNNVSSLDAHLTSSSLINGASLVHEQGGISAIDLTGGTGQNFSIENLNARNGDAAGNHLRFNDPIGGRLSFWLPTTGYKDILIKYVTRRSGSGAGLQIIEYSLDGNTYLPFGQPLVITETPTLRTLDFTTLVGASNNPNFKIRISFEAGSGGTVGNNRFDNVTAEGNSLSGTDTNSPVVTFFPAPNAINIPVAVAPSLTFNEAIRLVDNTPLNNTNVASIIELKRGNAGGQPVAFSATISGNVITLTPAESLLAGQMYYLSLQSNTIEDLSDNALSANQFTTFTTLSPQTVFSAGDLAFVAYQMNVAAPNNTDRFALLTFVDILPGTRINFTDNKVTTLSPAQCPGGFVWVAPQEGIKAGTVITLSENGVSHGTIEGLVFGLSANGDQILVYTGASTQPNYITALSSNAWATANTFCTGSLSMIPAPLTDGINALSLSTASGNAGGITANAYYNGSSLLKGEALKQAIHNPANWIGAASGTAQQTWPVWSFGPPAVVSAALVSSTAIRLVFNKDLDAATATARVNFTGIPNLSTVSRTDNGVLGDTLLLTYATPFVSGTSYTLTVAGIGDTEGNLMAAPYGFSFTYNTTVALSTNLLSVGEGDGIASVKILLENPSAGSVDLVVKYAGNSTASNKDYTYPSQTISLNGLSAEVTVNIPIINDREAESDEYFFLQLENPVGNTIAGTPHLTVYIRDNDRIAKVPSKEITLSHIGSVDVKTGSGSNSAEIAVYDPASKRLFVVNSLDNSLVWMDFTNPASPVIVSSLKMSAYGLGINSVAVKDGIVACAVESAISLQEDGSVVFFDTDGNFLNKVTVGTMPDMITFTPDGKKVLTANEGEPNNAYTIDPEGSVSVIDISGGILSLSQAQVTTLYFRAYDGREEELRAKGIRVYAGRQFSRDAEPEYITVSDDGKTAWVVLQENNAFIEINLNNNTLTDIWPLGYKDHMLAANTLDASDQGGQIHLSNWPVKGVYMPDAIAGYKVKGKQYLVGANEGDDREWSGGNERRRFSSNDVNLAPAVYPHAHILKQNYNLGRINVSIASGNKNAAGQFEEVHLIGGRSFAIWSADEKKLVYDSGDDFELFFSQNPLYRPLFNSNHETNNFKGRSASKGPEPEGVALAKIIGKTYAFVSLERIGGIMVYDISDPLQVKFTDYTTSRKLDSYGGDNGTEGIVYIAEEQSPDGKPYIVCANEISGTVSVYAINITNKGKQKRLAAEGTVFSEKLNLFPNPAREQLHLSAVSSVEIFDMKGLRLITAANTANVDISHLPKGLYMLRTSTGLVKKFVKE